MLRHNGSASRPVSLGSTSSRSQNATVPVSGRPAANVGGGAGRPRGAAHQSMAPTADANPRQVQNLQQRQQATASVHHSRLHQQQHQQPQQQHQQLLPQQRQQPRRPNPASTVQSRCNRCLKPLASNFFMITKCQCIFCEACTYAHFADNSACPRCKKQASDADFMELAAPGATATSKKEWNKATAQYLFGSPSATPGATVPLPQMTAQLLDVVDGLKSSTSVALRQFSLEFGLQASRASASERTVERIQSDFDQYKQQSESQLSQMQQSMDALKLELATAAAAYKEESARKAQLLAEFSQQHAQNPAGIPQQHAQHPVGIPQQHAPQHFRQPHRVANGAPVPASSPGGSTVSTGSRSHHSGGKRGPSLPPTQEPPKRQTHAALRGMGGPAALGPTRATHPLVHAPPKGGVPASRVGTLPAMTPIQVPPSAPYRTSQQARVPSSQPPAAAAAAAGTKFTSASGYQFLQGAPQRLPAGAASAPQPGPARAHTHTHQSQSQSSSFAGARPPSGVGGAGTGSGRPRSTFGPVAPSGSGSGSGSRPSLFAPKARLGAQNAAPSSYLRR